MSKRLADSKGIGERLKLARETAGITQKQVGIMLGIHKGAVCNYEIGPRTPPNTHLLPLAQLFGVSMGWLVGETEPRSTPELGGLSDNEFERLMLLEQPIPK